MGMKTKFVFTALCFFLFVQGGFAQKKVSQLFADFSKAQHVEHISFGTISMKLASLFTDVMGVDGIEILDLDSCNQKVKEDFKKAIKEIKDTGYETLFSVNDNDSRTRILVKLDKDVIREFIFFSSGDSNALISIKGKIKPSDIEKLVNDCNNG